MPWVHGKETTLNPDPERALAHECGMDSDVDDSRVAQAAGLAAPRRRALSMFSFSLCVVRYVVSHYTYRTIRAGAKRELMYARVVRSSVPTRWAHLFRHLFAACQARAASTLERVTSQSRVARNQGGHQEDVPRRWGFIRRVRPKNIVTCRREALPPRASPPGAWDAQVRLKVRPLIVFFSTLSFSGIARLSTCSQLDARRRMRVCSWLLVACT